MEKPDSNNSPSQPTPVTTPPQPEVDAPIIDPRPPKSPGWKNHAVEMEPATGGVSTTSTASSSAVDTDQPTSSPAPVKPKKSRKGLIIGLVSALLLVGAGAAAYYVFMVYQKPENVVLHAMSKLTEADKLRVSTTVEGDYAFGEADDKLAIKKVTFDVGVEKAPRFDINATVALSYGGKDIELKGDVLLTDSGDAYFRIENTKKLLETYFNNSDEGVRLSKKADELLSKLENKWVKTSLVEQSDAVDEKSAKVAQCVLDTYKKYKDDTTIQKEWTNAYKQQQFVVVKETVGRKDGAVGYRIEIDQAKAKEFAKIIENTAAAKELKNCDPEATEPLEQNIESIEEKADDNTKMEVVAWVGEWDHQLKFIDSTATAKVDEKTYTIKSTSRFDYANGATTLTPESPTDFAEWQKDFESAIELMFSGEMFVESATPQSLTMQADVVAEKAEAYRTVKREYPSDVKAFATEPSAELDADLALIDGVPNQSQIGYKRCVAGGAQILYYADGKLMARALGDVASGAVTGACA